MLVSLLIGPASAQVSVLSRQPARHAVAVPRDAPVSVSFSQPVSAATAGNLRVFGNLRRGRRAGSVSGGGTSTLTLTPGPAFAPGEVLSVSLPATLTSTGGLAVARQVYQFTAATGGAGRGFFGDTTVVGNTGSRDQLLGDLDNDGDLDLVTTGALYGCRIFLNNGAGMFSFKTGVIAAEEPSATALADVDQDGDLDLLVSDSKNSTVGIALNDGTGEFGAQGAFANQNAPVGPRPVGIATGDLDGDGDLDCVSVNADGGSATVFRNTTTYAAIGIYYELPATLSVGSGPSAVALADIDNDGDLDLLTAHAGTFANPLAEVHVSRNSGAGIFSAYTSLAVGARPSALTLADADGDGDLDLFTANAGAASVSLRLNNGSGGFGGTATLLLPAGSTPSGLSTGDVDADGDLDLLVAQGAGGRVITYLNTGGTFAAQARPLRLNRGAGSAVEADGVVLGDVDGDLDLDLITSDGHGQVLLSRNVGSLPPLPAPAIISLNPTAGPVGAVVTISGTALTDITEVRFNGLPAPSFSLNGQGTGLSVTVPAGASSGPVTVSTAEAGSATSPTAFTVTIPVPVLITSVLPARNAASVPVGANVSATFTAAITTATAGSLRVFGNQRRGRRPGTLSGGGTPALTFDPSQDFAPGEHISVSLPAGLQAADGNQVRGQVAQFTAAVGGTGQADFNTMTRLSISPVTLRAGEPTLGDLDNDGDLDLLTPIGDNGSRVSLQLNNGAGTFSSGPDLATGLPYNPARLVLGDLDADGDLDAAVQSDGTLSIQLNAGNGTFAPGQKMEYSSILGPVLLGDLDADGDLDVALLNGSGVVVWRNDGRAAFSNDYTWFPAAGRVLGVALGDADADGDLDLVLTTASFVNGRYGVSTQLNDGTGRFADGPALTLPDYSGVPGRLALGDLDGDGDLDLVLRLSYNAVLRASIRLNDGTGRFAGTADLPLAGVGLLLADADADGDLDIITHAGVGLGNGRGGFTAVLPIADPNPYASGVALGDVDGDGDLDLVTGEQDNKVSLRLNQPRAAPALRSFLPGSGPVGSQVQLLGTNLIGTRTIAFNGLAAPDFTVVSATEVLVTVPAGATAGQITLTTPGGTATSAAGFVVTQPVAVLAVSPAPNTPNAPRNTAITVRFAQPISSASAAGLRVFGTRLRGRRAGTITGGGSSTLTFTPVQAFAAGEAVSVSVPASLSGATGNAVRRVTEFTAAVTGTGTGLFMATGATDVAIHYSARGLVLGDLDNDGDQDLITTGGSVRLNDGRGAFSPAPANVVVRDAYHLILADVNADGTLDLVTSSGQIQLNDGSGAFTELPDFAPLTMDTREVAVGDLDGDGDLDIAFPKYSTDSLYVRFNDGGGLFPRQQLVAAGFRPVGVALGDVDNDGDLDVVVASEGLSSAGGTLSVGFNDGDGRFPRLGRVPVTYYGQQVRLGDLDRDGDLDLVTSNGEVRLNDGTGTFSGTQTTVGGSDIVLGDVDSDGDLDLVAVGNRTTALRLNDGAGQFSPAPSLDFGSDWFGQDVALADIDNDGDLDALQTNPLAQLINVRLNQRVAPPLISGFSPGLGLPGAAVIVTGTDLIGITGVEFNGTAAPGFVVNSAQQLTVAVPAGATSGPIRVVNPRGAASSVLPFTVLLPVVVTGFSPSRNTQLAPLTAPVQVSFSQAVPLNTDATLAVFSQQRGGRRAGTRTGAGTATLGFAPALPFQPGEQISVSIPAYTEAGRNRVVKQVYQFRTAVGGTGRGFFTAPATFELPDKPGAKVLGDIDNDGDLDLLTSLSNSNSVTVLRNNGAASFGPGSSVDVAPNASQLALGDVDGDGDLDLVATSWAGTVVSLRLNDGRGTFSGSTNVPVDKGPWGVALADMDGDGDLDLLTANSSPGRTSTSVRFNDGAGHFGGGTDDELTNTIYYNETLSEPQIGDVDGDGDLDLMLTVSGAVHLRLNDGHGVLTAGLRADDPARNGGPNAQLRDLDGDRDLDLVCLYVSSTVGVTSVLSVARNDGAGRFVRTAFDVLPQASGFDLSDLDADGDVDLLLTGSWSDAAQIWRNDGRGEFTFQMALPLGVHGGQPLLADLDGDQDLDLLHVNYYESYFSVRLNGPTPPPLITSFAPATGPEGTAVVVTGSGFLGTTAVAFNGVNAAGLVVDSPTQLSVKVPAGATTGPITVTTPVAVATSALPFTVLPLSGLSGLLPRRNALAAARTAPVQVTFGTAVTAATAGNLRVFGNQLRGRRPGTVTGGGTTALSFDPDQDFAPGEQVSVSLPATMLTTNGGLVRRQVYQFLAATGGPGRGFLRAGPRLSAGWYAADLTVGDLDNDGDLDLVLPVVPDNTSAGFLAVQLNDGQGQFRAGTSIAHGAFVMPTRVVLADIDGDGDLDALAGYSSSSWSICLNNGNATFAAARQLYNLEGSQLAVGDVDADGDLDLVTASYQASGVLSVALNDGAGSFRVQPVQLPSPTASAVELGDVDNDGDLDALTANGANGPRLYRNDGTGTFAEGLMLHAAGTVRGAAFGDADADGDLDVVVGYEEAPATGARSSWLTLLRNDGAGGFAGAGPRMALGRQLVRLRLGDLDHDGDLDAVAVDGDNDNVAVRLNDGQGLFSGTQQAAVSDNPGYLALGDLDGDGDLDVLTLQSATGGPRLDILLNESLGLSTASSQAAAALTLYPNPAHGQFTLRLAPALWQAAAAASPLRLYNALGQLVLAQALRLTAAGMATIGVAHLPPGIYALRLQVGAELLTRPLVIE